MNNSLKISKKYLFFFIDNCRIRQYNLVVSYDNKNRLRGDMKLDKVAILVKKATLEFDKIANAVLEEFDLTAAQYKVMKYLYTESEVRIVDLEKYYSMSHPTIIGIVQNLEKKGLIEYQQNPNNTRSRFIVPSALALKQRKKLERIGANLEAEFTKKLSDKERERLITLLKKMIGIEET